ncbi:MAG: ABC transporter ATP-binding protein [Actinobacteria bacterium]|nr:ABC transporter ATP-binding protein [Actinomycetota bacterium]
MSLAKQGSLVELSNLVRRFGEVTALDGLNLTIQPGELVALLGPSGCGKTTALRLLAGLDLADSGKVIVDGKDLTSVPASQRDMGMVFQAYSLFPNMTAVENVSFGLKVRGVDTETRLKKANELLDLVGLTTQANRYSHQMSGGQQQRVALARALAIEPKVLLLDEPLSALDAKVRTQLRDEIRRIQIEVGTTTLFVTHDQEEAMAMADRVGVMSHGKLEQIDRPNIVYSNPTSAFVASFVGAMNRIPAKLDAGKVSVLGQSVKHGGGASGSDLVALIRPESISVSVAKTSSANTGLVLARSFLGPQTRLTVTTSETKTNIHVDLPSSEAGAFAPGTTVGLKVEADSLLTDYHGKN